MASIYDLKSRFQALLRPGVVVLARRGVTANQVTLLALLLSFLCGGLITWQHHNPLIFFSIPVILFVRMALNAIDGMLAREHNMKSALGAILNELGDILSDAAIYLPFALVEGISSLWVVLVVIFAIVSETSGIIAVQIGAKRRYDGPMGKSDRAFVFGVVGFLLGLGIDPAAWMNYLLMVLAILLALTILNRLRQALKEVGCSTSA